LLGDILLGSVMLVTGLLVLARFDWVLAFLRTALGPHPSLQSRSFRLTWHVTAAVVGVVGALFIGDGLLQLM
jgi:hypothetical protein